MDETGNWKADLTAFLEELRQEEQEVATGTQRAAVLVAAHLNDTVIPALQEFKGELEAFGHTVEVTQKDGFDTSEGSVERSVKITVNSGTWRELETEISIWGHADSDMVCVTATDTDVTDLATRTLDGKPAPMTTRYHFNLRPNQDEPPTRADILKHLVVLFKQGAKHSKR